MLNLDFRPRRLKDVIGQDIVLKNIINRLKENALPEIMFFQGNTGVGKTTVANILASTLNCKNPIKQEEGYYAPCGECVVCKDVLTETFSRSVIVKDASDMVKQDVLNLEKELSIQSLEDQNKILIIEEAQQLASAGAKGALLKIFEKVRKNVYIILLTMDSKKFIKDERVRRAIQDRSQIFNFKEISRKQIVGKLAEIVNIIDPEEKLPDSIVEICGVIADSAQGSLRRAIEDLDKCIYSEIFTVKEYEKEFNILCDETVYALLDKYLDGDATVFENIKSYSYYNFYLYSLVIFLNMKESALTGKYSSPYIKEKQLAYWNTGYIDNLLSMYMRMNVRFSSDEAIIKFNLLDYFEKNLKVKTSRRRMVDG